MERFTAVQVREFNDAFYMFEAAGTGLINSEQLRDAFHSIGFNPTDKLVEIFKTELEVDGDGTVDFQGFVQLIDRMETAKKEEKQGISVYNHFE